MGASPHEVKRVWAFADLFEAHVYIDFKEETRPEPPKGRAPRRRRR